MGGDRSFNGMFTCVCQWFFYVSKNEKKRKQRMEREGYGENKEVENIEKNAFVIFSIFLKQSKKERKLMATNY